MGNMHVCGLLEEAGVPSGNPRRHRENIERHTTPAETGLGHVCQNHLLSPILTISELILIIRPVS